LTFKVAEALIVPSTAVIVVEPPPKARAIPAAVILAIAGCEEFQLTELVKSWVLPSAYSPVAKNC